MVLIQINMITRFFFLNQTCRAYPWLEKVYLKRMSLTNDDLTLLADSFHQFKELELVFCEGFGTKGLSKVAYNCR